MTEHRGVHDDTTSVMRKELFGVFGDRTAFRSLRSEAEFDAVVGGDGVTVGVRDPCLGEPNRTTVDEAGDGVGVVWGEAFTPGEAAAAPWLRTRYEADGLDAFSDLNGSYVAVVSHEGRPVVAVDPIRSWECFHGTVQGIPAFGTDVRVFQRLLDTPDALRESLLEFLHLGVVIGDRTLFDGVRRVPFDGYLTPAGPDAFDRFRYDHRDTDHAQELARRLERALERRAEYPGRKGLLLSAGQDSRSLLATIPDIDHCYTVGPIDSQEVGVARRVAAQYDADHLALAPDARYLAADDQKIRATQSIRESLHAHHAGYVDLLDVDTVYHGLLYDTLFKGYFLARAGVGAGGVELELKRPDDDVDPVCSLLDTLGFLPAGSDLLAERAETLFDHLDVDLHLDDPRGFLRRRFEAELEECWSRADSVHDAMDLLVLKNQPALSFRTHLADNYRESFVAADADLLAWHCQTPPRYRHPETVYDALVELDDEIFQHDPPGRPHRSELLNQVEGFARRTLPGLAPAEPAWPSRARLYERFDLDDYFFPNGAAVEGLPARQKLRVNDLDWWLADADGRDPAEAGAERRHEHR